MNLSTSTMSAIRFGTGIRPGEEPARGAAGLMAELKAGMSDVPLFPVGGIDARRAWIADMLGRLREARELKKDGDGPAAKRLQRKNRRAIRHALQEDRHARFEQAIVSPNGFHERLAFFWTDHFSVNAAKGSFGRLTAPLFEAEAIRPHMSGAFKSLLKAAVLHPAMLHYLDQRRSIGPNAPAGTGRKKGLNENLGRELLELHTLGVNGGYSQADVRAAALVLTGMRIDRDTGEAIFQRRFAEPGPISLLGLPFGSESRAREDVEDMLDALAGMERTARHITTKLVVHFISDTPPPGIVDAMVNAWMEHDGDLTSVYQAMLDHPAAWDNPGEKARQPFDFIVAGLRAIHAPRDALAMPAPSAEDAAEAAAMEAEDAADDDGNDMTPMDENTVAMTDGKPKAADKPGKPRRKEAGNPLTVRAAAEMGQPVWEPPSPAGWDEEFDVWITSSQLAVRIGWARQAANRFGTGVDPRELIKIVLADAARDDTIDVVRQAASRAAGTSFILASPEFNRR
jgi:uncharacterized protein (DUF1800 family)